MRLNDDIRAVAQAAVQTIEGGGVLLSPTDTVYGLACDPFRAEAVQRVLELKGRAANKGFLLLIEKPEWAAQLAYPTPAFERLAPELWPGPVTLLLEARPEAPPPVVSEQGKIGFRHPRDPFLQTLLKLLERPLLSTSANPSGQVAASDLSTLHAWFASGVDLFIEGEEPGPAPASTVVDLTQEPPRIVRPGADLEAVRETLESLDRTP